MTVSTLTPGGSAVPDRGSFSVERAARGTKPPVQSVGTGPSGNAFQAINGLYSSYQALGYYLPWEILDFIELLARFNPDYSQAVANIQTLANSGHEVFITAKSDLQQRRVQELIAEKARTVQERSGGIDGLIDKLLHQGAVFGAMAGEWLLSDDLTEVVDFADVNPKSIRFFWDEQMSRWLPYQKVTAYQLEQAKARGQEILNGCIKLNELTFHYYSFNNAPNSPYGVPPFLAALEPLAIQKDMTINMSQIVKKLGLLGIIDVAVKQLPIKPGEQPSEYQARAENYLDQLVGAVEDMVRDGGMVHYDDIDTKTFNITGNAAGATNIFKQNEEQVFSGLNSMPSVQGRSYSTTETYAGVAYDIIIRNTQRYQRACKRMIESGYFLMAGTAGLTPDKISLNFNQNKTLHRLQDAQAEAVEIKNGLTLWVTGVINQSAFGQRLGVSTIDTAMEKPPDSPLIGNAASGTSGDTSGDPGTGDATGTGDGKPNSSNNTAALRARVQELEQLLEQEEEQA